MGMARYFLRTLTLSPSLLAEDGKECVRFSKRLAVIVYLAARPEARATREELIGLLWEGSSQHDARQALRQVVYQIRHTTDPDFLKGDEVLTLCPETLEFDVENFRRQLAQGRLEEALACYAADFLATVGLAGAVEFELWAEGIRQQLAAERRQLLRTLIARAADSGRWADGSRYAQQFIDIDPADVEARLKLVELLALSGDSVRANAAAEAARRVAAEVHGDRTAGLEEAVARALAPAAASERRVASAFPHHPERRIADAFPRHPEMVGRATEFRAVVEKWKRALEGKGGAVLVSGEAGSGKTRLARELERRFMRDRALVLPAACYAIEQSDALAPFLELLKEGHSAPGLAAASPACLEVLAAFVPDIAARFQSAIKPRAFPIPQEALVAAVLDAFTAIADEVPLALVVEDLHWAPPATIEVTHRLARRAAGARLLLLTTARDFGRSPETARALGELTASGAVADLPLEPLDATDVEDLVSSIARLPDDAEAKTLAHRVFERSAGIPLYVLEVLKSLYDAGALRVQEGAWVIGEALRDPSQPLPVPETSEAILEGRLGLLSAKSLGVLTALAVWGRQSTVADIVRVTGFEQDDVVAALAALERRRLVGRLEGLPVVVHEELAAVALRKGPPALVKILHATAALLAEERARQGQDAEWAVAARHAAAAGDVDRAAAAAVHAASALTRSSGREAAREALTRLLADMPPPVGAQVEVALLKVAGGMFGPWISAPKRAAEGGRRR